MVQGQSYIRSGTTGSPPSIPKAEGFGKGRIVYRAVFMAWAIVLLTVAVFLIAIIPQQRQLLIEEMHQRAFVAQTSTAQILEESLVLDDLSGLVDHCISIVTQNPSLRYVIITPKEGPSLIHSANAWRQEELDAVWRPNNTLSLAQGKFMKNPFGPGEMFHLAYSFEFLGLPWGWIHLGLSTDKFRQDSRALYLHSGLIAAVAVSIGLVLSIFFARRISVPILELERFAQRIARGDLTQRISIHTGDEVEQLAVSFNDMVEKLQQANQEREKAQMKLVDTARQAGMAEMVSNVLHNVGNVLNSVGVTTATMEQRLVKSKIESLHKLSAIIEEQRDNLSHYLTVDPRGQMVPEYLVSLADHLVNEHRSLEKDVVALERHIQHVRDIIHLQQDYSRTRGLTELVSIPEIIDDALRLNSEQNAKHGINIQKEYGDMEAIWVDRHRLLQILINLLSNARHALMNDSRNPKIVRVLLEQHQPDRFRISVTDNGLGIDPQNLTRIFQHGFTTRKDGHGFGLHSSAIAARELSGSLTAISEGSGHGATFVIDLPLRSHRQKESSYANES